VESERRLIKKAEVFKQFGIPVSTVEKLTAERRIPHYKIGGRNYYDTAELSAWVESKKVAMSPRAHAVAC
jgi:excisionase family DNA binding protein